MKDAILQQISILNSMELDALGQKYAELFGGEKPNSPSIDHIRRKIAHRIQEKAYGGLSDEFKNKLKQFIRAYDPINNKALRQNGASQTTKDHRRDKRLPIPGAIISKIYKGTTLNVKVMDKGFEYDGKTYRTLSSIATAITGQHWNGYLFFGL